MRREVRERLRALSPESVNRSSGKTQDGLMACPEFGSADMVCCYLAVGPEVQTDRIIEACWRQGKKVCVPAFKSDTHSYELAGWEEGAATVAGPMGISEPATRTWVSIDSVDLMIVPGTAFDRHGGRLGRGGGHYDAIMRRKTGRSPFSIGLAFELQLLERVPVNDQDVKVDAVVTETKTIRTLEHKSE